MSFLNKFRHYIKDLFRYPNLKKMDDSYGIYWQSRGVNGQLNSFQKKRAELLMREIAESDSILDIGCGDGRILVYLKEKGHRGEMKGIDSSDYVLKKAKSRGLAVAKKDIRSIRQLSDLGVYDIIILFEVLEHMFNSEELLEWAFNHTRKSLIFSVPNTGFIFHRLRLLFGQFPLQWKAHPSEHLRFWTLKDMKWWLKQQGYKNFKISSYEGVPILNLIWPALFGQGLFIHIKKENIS